MLYLNGKFYDEDTSSKHYQYGMACFETIMGLSGKLVFFHEHIERLVKSLELLGINREIDYKGIVEETIKRSGLEIEQEFFIKILVSDVITSYSIHYTKLYEAAALAERQPL